MRITDSKKSRSDRMMNLLVISAVMPFPRMSGQRQRVYHKLKALTREFRVTFLGLTEEGTDTAEKRELEALCDDVILLPRRYLSRRLVDRVLHRLLASLYSVSTGLRVSNYMVGNLELTPERVSRAVDLESFDCALIEYWHAWRCVQRLNSHGVLSVLDMHDILWRSWERRLQDRRGVPRWWKKWAVDSYRKREEQAWRSFDALIAINAAERDEVKQLLPGQRVLYIPMGVDLKDWPYSWRPQEPQRVAYYGGLGNPARQQDAMWAYRKVMTRVWKARPETEFWLIGSNPPEYFKALQEKDPRIRVTGFLSEVQETLAKASVLLCPWSGTFGFRSRLVEAMALGVPVVASPDAAWGMELKSGSGIILRDTDEGLSSAAIDLLHDAEFSQEQSRLARREIEARYSSEATYERLPVEIQTLLEARTEEDQGISEVQE